MWSLAAGASSSPVRRPRSLCARHPLYRATRAMWTTRVVTSTTTTIPRVRLRGRSPALAATEKDCIRSSKNSLKFSQARRTASTMVPINSTTRKSTTRTKKLDFVAQKITVNLFRERESLRHELCKVRILHVDLSLLLSICPRMKEEDGRSSKTGFGSADPKRLES